MTAYDNAVELGGLDLGSARTAAHSPPRVWEQPTTTPSSRAQSRAVPLGRVVTQADALVMEAARKGVDPPEHLSKLGSSS